MTRKALCLFALVAALFLTGCQKQVSAPLTEPEQAAIRAEVTAAAKTLFAAFEALDLEAVERLSHDGPDFFYVTPDGKVLTFAEMKKVGEEMLASLSGQKMITQKERVIVLAPDAALYVWQVSRSRSSIRFVLKIFSLIAYWTCSLPTTALPDFDAQ